MNPPASPTISAPAAQCPSRGHFPQFLDSNRIHLRAPPVIEAELPHERLGEVAADAVGEDRDLGADVDAGFKGRLLLAVSVNAAIAGADTDDARRGVEQYFRRWKTGEDIDALSFHETGEPLDELVERDDVVAVILEKRRCNRKAKPGRAGQKINVVAPDL